MDSDLLTSGEAAAELGTSVPRLLRAARGGRVASHRRGNRTLFSRQAVEHLRREWGWAAPVAGLSRPETFVLAAVSRRPRGLRSTRAVARAAGVSPTTAGRALSRLEAGGLVERRQVREVAGRVRDAAVWTVVWTSPRWRSVAAAVSRVVLPVGHRPADEHVPPRLAHVFWNEDVRELRVDEHAVLIADRILRSADPDALAWGARHLPPAAFDRAATKRGLDPRTGRFARALARR